MAISETDSDNQPPSPRRGIHIDHESSFWWNRSAVSGSRAFCRLRQNLFRIRIYFKIICRIPLASALLDVSLCPIPPPRVLRFAANSRKCSLPYFRAVSAPPLRPMAEAAGVSDWLIRSLVSAKAARSNSMERAVRFCGRTGPVSKTRTASDIKFWRACRELRSDGITSSCSTEWVKSKRSLFSLQRNFQTLP